MSMEGDPMFFPDTGLFMGNTTYQPIGDRYSANQPIGDRYSADQPIGDRYSADQPIGDRFSPSSNVSDHQPTGDRFSADQPTGDRFSADQPTGDRFSANQPIGHRFSADQPTGDRFSANQPIGHRFSGDQDLDYLFHPLETPQSLEAKQKETSLPKQPKDRKSVLTRKNQLARNSRLKKKQYVAELEAELLRLRQIERLYLNQNLQTGVNAQGSSKDGGVLLTKEFYDLLDSGKVFQVKTTLHGVTKIHYITPCSQTLVTENVLKMN